MRMMVKVAAPGDILYYIYTRLSEFLVGTYSREIKRVVDVLVNAVL